MNFLRNFIMLGIAGAMFTACGDEPEVKVTKEETIPLELSKSELNFSETAQSEVITSLRATCSIRQARERGVSQNISMTRLAMPMPTYQVRTAAG